MKPSLENRKVAILIVDGFELREMSGPQTALANAGAITTIVSVARGRVHSWEHDHVGVSFLVEATVDTAVAEDFDALLVPGAVLNPDALRGSENVANFVRGFFRAGKPVAVISHGLLAMVEVGVVSDRTLTSYPSLRADLIRAGANWVDAAVVIDRGFVTSRSLADLEEFTERMIATFADHPRNGGSGAGDATPPDRHAARKRL